MVRIEVVGSAVGDGRKKFVRTVEVGMESPRPRGSRVAMRSGLLTRDLTKPAEVSCRITPPHPLLR
jgi:hypothetical protein